MTIYMMLPFVNRKMDRSNNDFRVAELPVEYKARFRSTNKYRFKRRLVEFHSKCPNFNPQMGNRWVFEEADPKTLTMARGGK